MQLLSFSSQWLSSRQREGTEAVTYGWWVGVLFWLGVRDLGFRKPFIHCSVTSRNGLFLQANNVQTQVFLLLDLCRFNQGTLPSSGCRIVWSPDILDPGKVNSFLSASGDEREGKDKSSKLFVCEKTLGFKVHSEIFSASCSFDISHLTPKLCSQNHIREPVNSRPLCHPLYWIILLVFLRCLYFFPFAL